jgi:hypothetical protein
MSLVLCTPGDDMWQCGMGRVAGIKVSLCLC